MRRYALILMLALSVVILPLMGRAQGDASAGSAAGSDSAAGCGKIQLGAVSGGEESNKDIDKEQTADDGALQDYYNYQQPAGGEQQTAEYSCNDGSNADGTVNCFNPSAPDVPIICICVDPSAPETAVACPPDTTNAPISCPQ